MSRADKDQDDFSKVIKSRVQEIPSEYGHQPKGKIPEGFPDIGEYVPKPKTSVPKPKKTQTNYS